MTVGQPTSSCHTQAYPPIRIGSQTLWSLHRIYLSQYEPNTDIFFDQEIIDSDAASPSFNEYHDAGLRSTRAARSRIQKHLLGSLALHG